MKYKIILSSNSPRRKELLAGLDLDYEVRVVDGIDESYPHDLSASEIPVYISKKKAAAIRFAGGCGTDDRLRRLARGSPNGFLEGHSAVYGVCWHWIRKKRMFSLGFADGYRDAPRC